MTRHFMAGPEGTRLLEPIIPEKKLEALVRAHPLLSHPFFSSPDRGLDAGELRAWLGQQYFMSISLAPCFAALYANSALYNWEARRGLLELANEEDWDSGQHSQAFITLLEWLGGSLEEVAGKAAFPQTQAVAVARYNLCSISSIDRLVVGALTLAYANEYANRFIFAAILKSIGPDLKVRIPKEYFTAHLRDEVEHGRILIKFAIGLSDETTRFEGVEESVTTLLDLRSSFFDGCMASQIGAV